MTPALYAACEKAVHVIKTDGALLRGGRATLFILSQINIPFTARLLMRLLMLPPLLWFVEVGYAGVADHRDFFAGFLFTKDHSLEAPEVPVPAAVQAVPLVQSPIQSPELFVSVETDASAEAEKRRD